MFEKVKKSMSMKETIRRPGKELKVSQIRVIKESKSMLTKDEIKKQILVNRAIFKKYKICKVGIFGSYVKGKAKKISDIDMLVEFEEVIDLFDFVNLIDEIKKILNINVDLATPDTVKPYIRAKILKEVEWIEGL